MYDPDQTESQESIPATVNGVSGEYLEQYIQRIERLEEEKSGIASDITDTYAEAKGNGFDTKIMRTIIKLRKMDKSELEEHQTILELYMKALGME